MAAFATPAELSTWAKGAVSASDQRSQPLLDGASKAIRRYCGWHIGPSEEVTLLIDGPGSALLQLPTLHMTDVDSILENGELVDVENYEWSETGEIRRLRNHWPARWTSRYRAIQVKFTHGFADISDVKQIVLQVCAAALSSPMGATREQAGQVSVSWATTAPGVAGGLSLLARDFQVLDSYKLPARL